MQHKLVVIDVDPRLLADGHIFTKNCSRTSPGMGIFFQLKALLNKAGVNTITASDYLVDPVAFQFYDRYMISDMLTSNTQQLIEKGVLPTILYSLESPNVAAYFYANLRRFSAKYKHTFLFEGFKPFIHPETSFHKLYWPNTSTTIVPVQDWSDRQFLVMIAGNKHKYSAGNPLSKIYTFYLKTKNKYPHNLDLYRKRLEAILYFSKNPAFNLFGTGWETAQGLPEVYFKAAQKAGVMPVADKVETLQQYKYSICFENCSYPSYITEKIFDCFFSGTIPVYLGAPDITDFIPSDSFIDFRNFKNFKELEVYLLQLPAQEAEKYLNAARLFIESKAFIKFTEQQVAANMLAALTNTISN